MAVDPKRREFIAFLSSVAIVSTRRATAQPSNFHRLGTDILGVALHVFIPICCLARTLFWSLSRWYR
jgi:hypothetical protein